MVDLARTLSDALARYLAGTDPRESEYRRLAAEHQALPIFRDWSGFIALRGDGQLLWIAEGEGTAEPDVWQRHLALVRAGESFPELAFLRPARGPDAVECSACGGTGVVVGVAANVRCRCGGLGWLPREVAEFLREPG